MYKEKNTQNINDRKANTDLCIKNKRQRFDFKTPSQLPFLTVIPYLPQKINTVLT